MQEVAARGGRIILITRREGGRAASSVDTMETIVLPDVPEICAPIVHALPIQMLAYHTAVVMGDGCRPAAKPWPSR